MARNRRQWYAVGAVAVVTVAAAAIAYQARPSSPAPPQSSPVPVVVPGAPGEAATVVPSDEIEAPDGSVYNGVDVWFVRMMIPHHEQAVELAALAPDRAASPQLRALAERISVAQPAEIAVLRAWLRARGLAEATDDHARAAMPGMQLPSAIRALAASTGDAFDRRFVEMMSDHHQGAVEMATTTLTGGLDERVQQLANAIAVEQSVEITRMRELVDERG